MRGRGGLLLAPSLVLLVLAFAIPVGMLVPTSTSTMNGRKMCVSPMRSPAKLNRSTTGPCTRPSAIIAWFTSPFWASRAIHPNVRTTRFSSSGNTTRMVSQPRHRERVRARKKATG